MENQFKSDMTPPSCRLQKAWNWGRCLTTVAVVLYLSFLLLLCLGLHHNPERNATLAFCNYLPMLFWLSPLCLLAPVSLIFRPWLLLVYGAGVLLFIGPGMGYRLTAPEGKAEGKELFKVMTYNRGEEGRESIAKFVAAEQPDVIAIQECSRRLKTLQSQFPDYPFGASLGAFVVLSKFPVKERELIQLPFGKRPWPIAALFTVERDGREVALYNVHFPTPRDALFGMRKGGFVLGMARLPGTSLDERRQQIEAYWSARITLAEQLAGQIQKEEQPTLVLGDFNTPPRGLIYRQFAGFLQDSHPKAGQGYGFSFPGTTRNPFALFGPWLRLDYIFADPRWEFVESKVESQRPSQHRAVTAALVLRHDATREPQVAL